MSIFSSFCHFFLDISIGIVDLLQELTDIDTLNESEDGANLLVDALVRNNNTLVYWANDIFPHRHTV